MLPPVGGKIWIWIQILELMFAREDDVTTCQKEDINIHSHALSFTVISLLICTMYEFVLSYT